MKALHVAVLFAAPLVLSACGNRPPSGNIFIPAGPALSWNAAWAQAKQIGPIAFQAVGQNATLNASSSPASAQPPYEVRITGACVTASSTTMNRTVQITAVASGSCYVLVDTSMIEAIVP